MTTITRQANITLSTIAIDALLILYHYAGLLNIGEVPYAVILFILFMLALVAITSYILPLTANDPFPIAWYNRNIDISDSRTCSNLPNSFMWPYIVYIIGIVSIQIGTYIHIDDISSFTGIWLIIEGLIALIFHDATTVYSEPQISIV